MRRLVLVLVLGLFVVSAAPAVASAAPPTHAPKFVGTYRLTLNLDGRQVFHKMALTIEADGVWVVGDGAGGAWSNRRRRVTLVNSCCQDVFPGKLVGVKTVKGINSWRNPGPWWTGSDPTPGEPPSGTWYAVKMS